MRWTRQRPVPSQTSTPHAYTTDGQTENGRWSVLLQDPRCRYERDSSRTILSRRVVCFVDGYVIIVIVTIIMLYYFSFIPIMDDGAIECPLVKEGSMETVRLKQGDRIRIHTLYLPLEKAQHIRKYDASTSNNEVLMLYNEYMKPIYYTPANSYTPLMSMLLAEPFLPVNAKIDHSYRNVAALSDVEGSIGNDVATNYLTFFILDLGGQPIVKVFDSSGKRRPAISILLEIRSAANNGQ